MKKVKLSIVILSYNTKDLLSDCLVSLSKRKDELNFEVIVADNGSVDGSISMVETKFPKVKLVRNNENIGFAAGNNRARKYCKGKYVLFLNPDTKVFRNTLKKTVEYLDDHPDVGAVTCKVVLQDGSLDKDSRRSFITPWIGFVHLFLKLDRVFPKSKIFGQYWYGYISDDVTHEVDAIQGAYFLVRKNILDDVKWFDEDYFLDAEDIDLCWKIRKKGWKIMYYPKVKILHVKGAAKGKKRMTKSKVPLRDKLRYRMAGVNSMEIFVKKRLWNEYPLALMMVVLAGIKALKFVRFIKTIVFDR